MQRVDLVLVVGLLRQELLDPLDPRLAGMLKIGLSVDLALDVANQAGRPGPHLAQIAHRLFVAAAMDQPADFASGAPRQPKVGLAQIEAVFLGQFVQPFDRAQKQMAVRGVRDRFGLRRRVDGDALHLRFVDRLGPRGRRQRFREQEFKLFRADAPAPDRHRRAIERQLGLEIGLAAEELEIGVLDPLRADLVVRDAARVFEQMQADHQSSRQTRAPLLSVKAAERFVEALPVDQPRQTHQLVAHVDHVVEPVAEHVRFAVSRRWNGVGSHRSLLRLGVNHGARRQGIAARRRKKKTQGSSSITRKTLQTQIPCYAGIIMKCTRLRDFHGRLAIR